MSVANDVANAAVVAIQELNLVPSTSVVRRKAPTLPNGVDPPQIVVVIKEEGDTEYQTARRNLIKYPLAVVIITGGGRKLIDDDTLRLWRQQIRQTLDDKERTTFAGVSGFNRMSLGGKQPFDPAALVKDLNYSTQLFTAEVREVRAA